MKANLVFVRNMLGGDSLGGEMTMELRMVRVNRKGQRTTYHNTNLIVHEGQLGNFVNVLRNAATERATAYIKQAERLNKV